jgi:hypothetical protein
LLTDVLEGSFTRYFGTVSALSTGRIRRRPVLGNNGFKCIWKLHAVIEDNNERKFFEVNRRV